MTPFARLTALALWGVFVLTLAFGGAEFLRACGFGGLNYCPAGPVADPRVGEFARSEELRRLIHMAELRLAEKPPCPPPLKETEKAIERAYDNGAKRGMLEVFLAWKTRDDLDLVIFCPNGGSIGGANNHTGSCGDGAVDVDANRNLTNNVSDTPTEHAVWDHVIPDGVYRIGAMIYVVNDPGRSRKIPFSMIFKQGDQTRTCEGAVTYYAKSAGRRTRDGKAMVAEDMYIDWTSGGDPPACRFLSHEDPYCSDKACQSR